MPVILLLAAALIGLALYSREEIHHGVRTTSFFHECCRLREAMSQLETNWGDNLPELSCNQLAEARRLLQAAESYVAGMDYPNWTHADGEFNKALQLAIKAEKTARGEEPDQEQKHKAQQAMDEADILVSSIVYHAAGFDAAIDLTYIRRNIDVAKQRFAVGDYFSAWWHANYACKGANAAGEMAARLHANAVANKLRLGWRGEDS